MTRKPFRNNSVFATTSMMTASNKAIVNTTKSKERAILSKMLSKEFGYDINFSLV